MCVTVVAPLAQTRDSEEVSVLEVLKSKHPPPPPPPSAAPMEEALVEGSLDPPSVHPVIYQDINAKTIHSAALCTSGAAGPSGIDARGWRRMCCSFKSASDDLCNSLALLTRHICSEFVDPDGLAALLSCRLIALDKDPGVRPIGVCEVVRRIMAKAILKITGGDVQDAAGSIHPTVCWSESRCRGCRTCYK